VVDAKIEGGRGLALGVVFVGMFELESEFEVTLASGETGRALGKGLSTPLELRVPSKIPMALLKLLLLLLLLLRFAAGVRGGDKGPLFGRSDPAGSWTEDLSIVVSRSKET